MRIFGKKRIHRTIILLTLILIIGAFCLKRIRCFVYNNELPAEAIVKHVIDGDTVLLKRGEKVRYLGINAPEVRVWNGTQWVPKRQLLGKEAMMRNKRLVEGKRIQLEYDQEKRDAYDRLLAYVRVGDVFVNGKLIQEGLALMDVRTPNVKYQDIFLGFQTEARRYRRGLWGEIENYTISDREAVRHIGSIGVVRGKIVNVYKGSRKVYLNFGNDFQKDFTGVIYRENLRNFSWENNDPVGPFLGKRVRIYGFIKESGGPAITICAPSQIDILH